MAKLKKAELEKVQNTTSKYNEAIQQLGYFQLSQQELLTKVSELKSEVESIKVDLQKKYGNVEINLVDGEITEVLGDVENKKD